MLLLARLLLALAGLPLSQPPPLAARSLPAPDALPRLLRAHVAFLADDALEGRGTGTRGGLIAAEYVAAQFRRLGLAPAGDSAGFLQRVHLLGRTPNAELRATPDARAAGAGPDTAALRWAQDYVLAPEIDDTVAHIGGELVFAGYGVVAPNRGWDDYKGADLRGKVALVLAGVPDPSRFDPGYGRPWNAVREKAQEAARRGAVGILVVDVPESGVPWEAIQALTRERIGLPAQPDAVRYWGWVTPDAAASLAALGDQDFGRLMRAARDPDFRPTPLGVSLGGTLHVAIRPIETQNVVARLPGSGPHAREAVVVGAHYDHLGIGRPVYGDSIYNGAEDNASGVAGVLGAAEKLAATHPARSIYFVAFGAEELGLLGSQWFVAHPPVPQHEIVAAVAMDELNLYGATRDIGTVGVDQTSLGAVVRRAAAAEGMRINEDPDDIASGRFYRSDNYSFARAGIPTIRLVNGLDYVGRPGGWGREQRERYHTEREHRPSDELAPWMSFAGIAQQTRVLARSLRAIADAPARPRWAAGSDFRAVGDGVP
ncbi:MAG TPA: M20/M25/M40 family metallo-hydrolase [Gemmatimonadales bacterium]|nr:M20/M25/M40 family metallo-hydrolase [Gemmatimonadales bacterium]